MTAAALRAHAAHLPLPDASVDLVVTSPPYFGLRSYTDTVKCLDCIEMEYNGRDPRQAWPDYGRHVREVHQQHYAGQIGSEATPGEWLEALWACTREWVRVLKPEGSLFVNLGDKYDSGTTSTRTNPGTVKDGQGQGWYQGTPRISLGNPKSLLGLPWRYAIGCMDRLGLILRAEIVWAKPNGLPESVTDRVRRAHEQVFHFTRLPRYYAAVDEIREPHTGNAHAARKDKGPSPWSLAIHANGDHGMRHSNTDPSMFNLLGKLPGSVWDIPSQPLSVPAHLGVDHFAAFPMELPRRLVLGWSPPGVCTACHQGRRPVVDKAYLSSLQDGDHAPVPNVWKGDRSNPRERASDGTFLPRENYIAPGTTFGKGGSVKRFGDGIQATITGYACGCPEPSAPTRPATVLDPFGGTGTTALVASVLGRHGITADLSADYCRLAAWRTSDPGERARAMQVPKPPPVPDGQAALFAL